MCISGTQRVSMCGASGRTSRAAGEGRCAFGQAHRRGRGARRPGTAFRPDAAAMTFKRDLYDASLEGFIDLVAGGEGWTRPLWLARDAFGATGAIFMGYDTLASGARAVVMQGAGVADESTELYTRHYVGLDVRAQMGMRFDRGAVLHDALIGSPADLDRTPIYAELFHPFDLGRFLSVQLGGEMTDTATSFFTLLFGASRMPPTDEEAAALQSLAHVVRASQRAAAAVRVLRVEAAGMAGALDRTGYGVIVLSRGLKVLHLNAVAHAILARNDGFSLQRGTLQAPGVVYAGIRKIMAARRPLPQTVSVRRSEARSAYPVMILDTGRLAGAQAGGARDSALALLIADPDARAFDAGPLWRLVFQLSGAECEVAQALMQGLSPHEIASARSVSIGTVKSQIKHLYAKLDVTSLGQALARLRKTAPFDP